MRKLVLSIAMIICGMILCGCNILDKIRNDLDPFRVDNSTPGVEIAWGGNCN